MILAHILLRMCSGEVVRFQQNMLSHSVACCDLLQSTCFTNTHRKVSTWDVVCGKDERTRIPAFPMDGFDSPRANRAPTPTNGPDTPTQKADCTQQHKAT
eukprot:m.443483 g.443483  ORF g.443483 m.443483 type:complete len:100 (+) comp21484_c0_seq12:2158-2457(+)